MHTTSRVCSAGDGPPQRSVHARQDSTNRAASPDLVSVSDLSEGERSHCVVLSGL